MFSLSVTAKVTSAKAAKALKVPSPNMVSSQSLPLRDVNAKLDIASSDKAGRLGSTQFSGRLLKLIKPLKLLRKILSQALMPSFGLKDCANIPGVAPTL